MTTIRKTLCLIVMLLCSVLSTWADYTDIPWTISSSGTFTHADDDGTNYTFSTKTGYYQEWDHYVIFWSTGYGKQSGTPTSIGSGSYALNLSAMKTYAEKCFTEYTSLGFLDPTSSECGKHKIIILAYYSTGWNATGSGEGKYGTLNISHSSADATVSMYTYCHEIAHAYQFLGNAKNGGNAGFQYGDYYGYVSYYECCGNWQAAQIYNDLYFPESASLYTKTTNLGFVHQWHCYQSYPLNDYLTEKCGKTTIGDIWTVNTNTKYADPLEKYMSLYDKTAEDVYRDVFFAAMRSVTWDLDRWQTYLDAEGTSWGKHVDHRNGTKASSASTANPASYSDNYNILKTTSTYQYVTTNSSSAIHQVAYSSAPQSTGYNIIKLNVPSSSTNRTVTTTFTALSPGASLASGDNKEYWMGSMWAKNSSQSKYNTSATEQCNSSFDTYKTWRGFRLGYVAWKSNGDVRYYNYTDKVYCTGTSESSVSVSFDVPTDVDSLYFVVSPALSNYLRMGSVDPYNISTDAKFLSTQQSFDQWPYRVQFYNTNIYGLSNPSTTFSGTADAGTTYTTDELTDLNPVTPTEKTYTITVADGAPDGAGFTVSDALTSIGNSQYTTTKAITTSNVSSYVFPTAVDGYTTSIAVDGTTITITYTEIPAGLNIIRNLTFPATSDWSGTTYTLSSSDLTAITAQLGCTTTQLKNSSNWETADSYTAAAPTSGKFALYAVDPSTGDFDANTTANGWGYWMDLTGDVVDYGDGSMIFMEYAESTGIFTIGEYPDALSAGNTCPLRFALRYTNTSGVTNTVYITFNCTISSTTSTKYAYTIATASGSPSGAGFTTTLTTNTTFNNYESTTEITSSNVNNYVTATTVSGYTSSISVNGSEITIKYTADLSPVYTSAELTIKAYEGTNTKVYYATFSNGNMTFFPQTDGTFTTTVYKTYVEDGTLKLTELEKATASVNGTNMSGYFAPLSTGILIKATFTKTTNTKISYYTVSNKTVDAIDGNMLRPATQAMETDGSYKFFKLAYRNWTGNVATSTGLGFFYGAADGAPFTVNAGGAYLAVPEDEAAKMVGFSFNEDDTDGINSVNDNDDDNDDKLRNDNDNDDDDLFNIAGQRISVPQKGQIYIKNGQKFICK